MNGEQHNPENNIPEEDTWANDAAAAASLGALTSMAVSENDAAIAVLSGSSILSLEDGRATVSSLYPLSLVDIGDDNLAVDSAYILAILDDLRLSSTLSTLAAYTVGEIRSASVVAVSGYSLLDEHTPFRIATLTGFSVLGHPVSLQSAASVVSFSLVDTNPDPIIIQRIVGHTLTDITANESHSAALHAYSALTIDRLFLATYLAYALYDNSLDPIRLPALVSYSLVEATPIEPLPPGERTKVSLQGHVRISGSGQIRMTKVDLVTVDQNINLDDPDFTID